MDNPEYISIPHPGTKCPHSGLSRSGIYNLISATKANGYRPMVLSTVVRLPGKKRGRRIVVRQSLMQYLASGVVSHETMLLRRAWAEHKASQRDEGRTAAPAALLPSNPDDLPDDAIIWDSANR
jgi:hypothetical protein